MIMIRFFAAPIKAASCIAGLIVFSTCSNESGNPRPHTDTAKPVVENPTVTPKASSLEQKIILNVDFLDKMPRLASARKSSPKASPKSSPKISPKLLSGTQDKQFFLSAQIIARSRDNTIATTPLMLFYRDEPDNKTSRLAISEAALVHGEFQVGITPVENTTGVIQFSLDAHTADANLFTLSTLVSAKLAHSITFNPAQTIRTEVILADPEIPLIAPSLTNPNSTPLSLANTALYQGIRALPTIKLIDLTSASLLYIKQRILTDPDLQKDAIIARKPVHSDGQALFALLTRYQSTMNVNKEILRQHILGLVETGDRDAVASLLDLPWVIDASLRTPPATTPGDTNTGTPPPTKTVAPVPVIKIFATTSAFAALKSDGSVVTWGNAGRGGDSKNVASQLQGNVQTIFSNDRAFAALKADGSLVTWGYSTFGGDSNAVRKHLNSGVVKVFGNFGAFAALKADGSVVTWGRGGYGVDSNAVAGQLQSAVANIAATGKAFAALKSDGSVITWGDSFSGGDSNAIAADLESGVTAISATISAFAALKNDGSVVTWGSRVTGGDTNSISSDLSHGVQSLFSGSIYRASSAFTAFKNDGSLLSWGDITFKKTLTMGLTTVRATHRALAALQTDGAVVTWGDNAGGGDSNSVRNALNSGVSSIYSTYDAFAAKKTDGAVITWGNPATGGDSNQVRAHLTNGVIDITTSHHAFAARKQDGSVITWGDPFRGGDSNSVSTQLKQGVQLIVSTSNAFAALKGDGSVVTWGTYLDGGDSNDVIW